jgi:hypothetical protein
MNLYILILLENNTEILVAYLGMIRILIKNTRSGRALSFLDIYQGRDYVFAEIKRGMSL